MGKSKNIFLKVAVVVVLAIVAFFGYNYLTKNDGVQGAKTIYVKIVDSSNEEEKVVLEDTYHTDTVTLEELLTELNTNKEIVLETSDSAYGKMVTGLGKEEAIVGDGTDGKWWAYDSVDNKQCVSAGFCDGISILNIEDGDHFVFTLTKY